MSCVLHAVGKMTESKNLADRTTFVVETLGFGEPDETGRIPKERTEFVVMGRQMNRFRQFIHPNDLISVEGQKITKYTVDEHGDTIATTIFRVLSSPEALVKIYKPTQEFRQQRKRKVPKEVDDAFGGVSKRAKQSEIENAATLKHEAEEAAKEQAAEEAVTEEQTAQVEDVAEEATEQIGEATEQVEETVAEEEETTADDEKAEE